MLDGPTFELKPPAVDDDGPHQIPIFQNPQGCKPDLADVLAEMPVATGKHKGALDDAARGALGRRQERFSSLFCHAPGLGNWKIENGNRGPESST